MIPLLAGFGICVYGTRVYASEGSFGLASVCAWGAICFLWWSLSD